MNNLKTVVYQRLEAIAAAEKITRVELRELSRELLQYVPESQDIEIVNRLVKVLTPMNAQMAIHFFAHFLPWDVEKDKDDNFVRFGGKHQGEKRVNKKLDAIKDFLADADNNIWTWAKGNLDLLPAINLKSKISDAVAMALKGKPASDKREESPPISVAEVVLAVLDGGVTLADMLSIMEPMQQQMQEAEAKAA